MINLAHDLGMHGWPIAKEKQCMHALEAAYSAQKKNSLTVHMWLARF